VSDCDDSFTSILDIKTSVSGETRIPLEKIKILHKRKPVADSKALKDLVSEEHTIVEFSVMVIGGAAAVQPAESEGIPSGVAVVQTEAFWNDLRAFLVQKVRDEKETAELLPTFRSAWEASR